MAKLASLNLKVSPELKAEFVKTAEALGMARESVKNFVGGAFPG